MTRNRLSAIMLAVCAMLSSSHAATLVVTNATDGAVGSLRQRIQTAASGDVITFTNTFAGQTLTLTNEIVLPNNLTITATNLVGGVIIDGGPGSNRVFYLGTGRTNRLSGLTITGGGGHGASDPGSGGALYATRARWTISDCTIVSNTSPAVGAGLASFIGSSLEIQRCIFAANSAGTAGGGIFSASTLLDISDSSFESNAAGLFGGGYQMQASTGTLVGCSFLNNSAAETGGALQIFDSSVTVSHSTISGNSATDGGAILLIGFTATLRHVTISGNSAILRAGGIGLETGSSIALQDSIVAGNSAPTENDIRNDGTITRVGTNIVQTAIGGSGTLIGSGTILAVDPLLGPLANNGGRTMTMALLPGSPALDGAGGSAEAFDQRGHLRPREGNGDGLAVADLGAMEMQTPPAAGPELFWVTTAADELNAVSADGAGISLREVLRDAFAGGGATFDTNVFNGSPASTITLSNSLGEIVLAKNATIDASARVGGVTISGGSGSNRIFSVSPGTQVTLADLSLRGGDGYGAVLPGNGGAVLNEGVLTLTRCSLASNTAPVAGGAIYNSFSLAVLNSTLARNASVDGGGVYNAGGLVSITHSTVATNTATGSGGGVYVNGGSLAAANSIIANNSAPTGPDVLNLGTFNRTGANIVRSVANFGTLSGTTPLTSDPKLRTLRSVGGALCMPPLYDSPALDAAVGSTATNDQRRGARPVAAGFLATNVADLGAIELQRIAYVVTNGTDTGLGTLRAGVTATATNGPDATWITFAPALNAATIVLTNELGVTNLLVIDAVALPNGLTVDGGPGGNRIFRLTPQQYLTLRGLRLVGGGGTSVSGGAINSLGNLHLIGCSVSSNSATAEGGGIYAGAGSLRIEFSLFSYNQAPNGGGVYAVGPFHFENSTFSANVGQGGGIELLGATGLLHHITVARNTNSVSTAAGIYASDSAITTAYSIAYGNVSSVGAFDVQLPSGSIEVIEYNLFGSDSISTVTGSGILINNDPLLGPLADNGGPTLSHALLPGSIALDLAFSSSLSLDQRGLPRFREGNGMVGVYSDLGAVEMQTPPALGAEQQLVTTTADEFDAFGVLGAGRSLREAVNDPLPSGQVAFDPALFNGEPGDRIVLSNALGQIILSNNVQILAAPIPGGVTVDGGPGSNRIFRVAAGVTARVERLTLTGGGGYPDNANGGAIRNEGHLTLANCLVVSNRSDFSAGGIDNRRFLLLADSTIAFNGSVSGGGGIENNVSATLLIASNSTFYGNDARAGQGGGLRNNTSTTSLLAHCTFTENLATNFLSGGGIFIGGGTVTLVNSIVASNRATSNPDIAGSPSLSGANITGGNPRLAPLGHYGGLTPTVALLPGSPARNASVGSTRTVDQRGFPTVGTPDIGAYEAGTVSNYNAWIWESLTNALADHSAGADVDGDFVSNGDEWSALTDPGNGNVFLSATFTPGTQVAFQSVTNRTYRLQQADTAFGIWSNAVSAPIAGDGTVKTFATPAGAVEQYFRLIAGP